MFKVITPAEAKEIFDKNIRFAPGPEEVSLSLSLGRVLARPAVSPEYVPDFDRSTVDGHAVKSSDTFGCSESLPALLVRTGEVLMGQSAPRALKAGECIYVPTGGEVPKGADAVAMIEYSEDYGDGTIGIVRPCAPGENVIFRGDDLKPGQEVVPAGTRIGAKEIGAFASMGMVRVPVAGKIRAGIISTGDELIDAEFTPKPGQIRNVNSPLLEALITESGALPVLYGICTDRADELRRVLQKAVEECDLILVSGGSSVGTRDLTCSLIEECGEVLFHGIAMKPGKPTIFGMARRQSDPQMSVPVFGLPGHPGAAFFVSQIFIRPLLRKAAGMSADQPVKAILAENISANHGRAQYAAVFLESREDGLYAKPLHTKSGLITGIAAADGYFEIPGDTEGLPAGAEVEVYSF